MILGEMVVFETERENTYDEFEHCEVSQSMEILGRKKSNHKDGDMSKRQNQSKGFPMVKAGIIGAINYSSIGLQPKV